MGEQAMVRRGGAARMPDGSCACVCVWARVYVGRAAFSLTDSFTLHRSYSAFSSSLTYAARHAASHVTTGRISALCDQRLLWHTFVAADAAIPRHAGVTAREHRLAQSWAHALQPIGYVVCCML